MESLICVKLCEGDTGHQTVLTLLYRGNQKLSRKPKCRANTVRRKQEGLERVEDGEVEDQRGVAFAGGRECSREGGKHLW